MGVMLAIAIGCEPAPTDPAEIVVAEVGDRPLMLAEFETYLAEHLIEPGEPAMEESAGEAAAGGEPELDRDAEVKSRLFDAFVEEYMLLAEALERGIEVEPWELEAYISVDEPGGEADEIDFDTRKREALRRLLVQKLREEATLALAEPTDEEVREFAEEHREELIPERRLELRALMLESLDQAKKIHRDIKRRHITFNEAVVRYEAYPGQSRAQVMDWESLSEEVRAAVEGLKRGRVSEPVDINGNVYLFRVETWLDEPEQQEEALFQRARRELELQRRQQALDELVAEVRKKIKLRVKRKRLPFKYRLPNP
jgi:hypothetical protein